MEDDCVLNVFFSSTKPVLGGRCREDWHASVTRVESAMNSRMADARRRKLGYHSGMSIPSGTRLGPYTVLEQLGQGGMATVYKAYHAAMQRHVALKVLPKEFAKDPSYMGRFEQEARVLANLEHPHILPVYDFGSHDDYTFLVMRLLPGGTLKDLIYRGPLPIKTIHRVFTQVGEGLAYAHKNGVIHRDVKPSNVMIDQHGWAFLTDFGIAKLIEGSSQFTMSGVMVGTPAYMSPEQVNGVPADARADIYAWSIVLYEMITGRVPFSAETPMAVALKHLQEPLPLPRTLIPNLPEAVQDVLLTGLAKDPNDRFQSIDEMLAAWQSATFGLIDIDQPFTELAGASTLQMQAQQATFTTTAGAGSRPASAERQSSEADKATVAVATPETTQPPAAAPAAKRGGIPRWVWAAGGAVLLCMCAFVALAVVNNFRNRAVADVTPGAGTELTGQETALAATAPPDGSGGPPLATVAPPDGVFAPVPIGTLLENVEILTNPNTIATMAVVGDRIWTGGPGGLAVWEPGGQARVIRDLANTQINGIAPDPTEPGVLWLATNGGVIRLAEDGSTVVYDTADGLAADQINDVLWVSNPETGESVLFAATAYGPSDPALSVLTDGQWQLLPGPFSYDSVGNPDVVDAGFNFLATHPLGWVLVGTNDGLAAFDGENWQVFKDRDDLPSNAILSSTVINPERVALGTEQGVVLFDGEVFELVPQLAEEIIVSMARDGEDNVWFGTTYGTVYRFEPPTNNWETFELPDVRYSAVTDMRIGPDGNFWLATGESGLVVYRDGQFLPVRADLALPLSYPRYIIRAPLPDQPARLLLVGDTGQSYFFRPGEAGFTPGPRIPDYHFPQVFGLQGVLWSIAPEQGVSLTQPTGETRVLGPEVGVPTNTVYQIVQVRQQIWLATSTGLLTGGREDSSALAQFEPVDVPTLDQNVRVLLGTRDESLWLATDTSIAWQRPDGEWRVFTLGEGPLAGVEPILDMAEASNGDIWFGPLNGGALRYSPATDQWTYQPEVLEYNAIQAVAISAAGEVWLGGYYSGVVRSAPQGWETVSPPVPLADPNVLDMVFDAEGGLWIVTDFGLTHLPLRHSPNN